MKIKLSEEFLRDMKAYHGMSEEDCIQEILKLGVENETIDPDEVYVDIKGNFSLKERHED